MLKNVGLKFDLASVNPACRAVYATWKAVCNQGAGIRKFETLKLIVYFSTGYHALATEVNRFMLSETELENVFAWRPYRTDWPLNILNDQTILSHFGPLIKDMINNKVFECTQTQAGDLTNYLEFLCYPSTVNDNGSDQSGILVCISLCAPVVAYCETVFKKDKKSFAYAFPDPAHVSIVGHPNLKPIEKELKSILKKYDLQIISNEYATQVLPARMADKLDSLNFGNKMLHGIFQWKE
ncbi:hypothetical protein [Flavitalea sp.]|nr:hypothetical protein [Flavitalea sp.]